jgi:hypothetical protein
MAGEQGRAWPVRAAPADEVLGFCMPPRLCVQMLPENSARPSSLRTAQLSRWLGVGLI